MIRISYFFDALNINEYPTSLWLNVTLGMPGAPTVAITVCRSGSPSNGVAIREINTAPPNASPVFSPETRIVSSALFVLAAVDFVVLVLRHI